MWSAQKETLAQAPYDAMMAVVTKAPVKLSGTYPFPAFDRLIGQLAPLFELGERQPLDLDMRECRGSERPRLR